MGHLAFMQTLSFTLPRGGVKLLVRYAVKFFCVVLLKIAIADVGRVGECVIKTILVAVCGVAWTE